MNIGEKIKKIRTQQNKSTYELADIINKNGFKISQSAISKIENGRKKIDIETLKEIAKALDIEVDLLIVNQEPNTGEKIKYFREKAHLTQKELGKKVYKSEISIRKYESGKVNIPLSVQLDICRVLQITPYELQAGFKIKKETNDIDLSKVSTLKLIEELNSREDFPIKIAMK